MMRTSYRFNPTISMLCANCDFAGVLMARRNFETKIAPRQRKDTTLDLSDHLRQTGAYRHGEVPP